MLTAVKILALVVLSYSNQFLHCSHSLILECCHSLLYPVPVPVLSKFPMHYTRAPPSKWDYCAVAGKRILIGNITIISVIKS